MLPSPISVQQIQRLLLHGLASLLSILTCTVGTGKQIDMSRQTKSSEPSRNPIPPHHSQRLGKVRLTNFGAHNGYPVVVGSDHQGRSAYPSNHPPQPNLCCDGPRRLPFPSVFGVACSNNEREGHAGDGTVGPRGLLMLIRNRGELPCLSPPKPSQRLSPIHYQIIDGEFRSRQPRFPMPIPTDRGWRPVDTSKVDKSLLACEPRPCSVVCRVPGARTIQVLHL